jgi:23S rRNA pseudouridine1911/1915/1917 synthase
VTSEPGTNLTVEAGQDGERLDRFLVDALAGATRAEVKRLLQRGDVRVGGKARRKGDRVHAGEVVRVVGFVAPDAWAPEPDASLAVEVLHEDAELVVVDKPAGVACHPLRHDEVGTVASALVARYPELADAGDERREAGLVHRLDTSTSGVLVFARTRAAFESLVRQIRGEGGEATARKTYDVLVEGDATGLSVLDRPLIQRRRKVDVVLSSVDAGGQKVLEARTEVTPLSLLGKTTRLEARISAGRRHQIRAHLADAGHPIVGDELYGARLATTLGRPFLHARRIELRHPATGAPLVVEAPLAADLRALLERLGAAVGP